MSTSSSDESDCDCEICRALVSERLKRQNQLLDYQIAKLGAVEQKLDKIIFKLNRLTNLISNNWH